MIATFSPFAKPVIIKNQGVRLTVILIIMGKIKDSLIDKMNDEQPNMATIDHVVPMSKGGDHTYDNVRTMCVLCNSRKSNKDAKDIVPVLRSGAWQPSE